MCDCGPSHDTILHAPKAEDFTRCYHEGGSSIVLLCSRASICGPTIACNCERWHLGVSNNVLLLESLRPNAPPYKPSGAHQHPLHVVEVEVSLQPEDSQCSNKCNKKTRCSARCSFPAWEKSHLVEAQARQVTQGLDAARGFC